MPYVLTTPCESPAIFFRILALATLLSCQESEIKSGSDTAWAEELVSTGLRIDIYPSDSLGGVLPQSFRIEDGASWSNLDLLLQPSVEIKGKVQGYSTYPTIDIVLPGELVSVEAQLQLQQKASVAGRTINTATDGTFAVTVPRGENYFLGITPLSPQNVPYTVLDELSLQQSLPSLDIDLTAGRPIFGFIQSQNNHPYETLSVQLIDSSTGLRGPLVDVAQNGHFMIRAPENRSDFILQTRPISGNVAPVIQIPFHLPQDEDGLEVNVDLGSTSALSVGGFIQSPFETEYQPRAKIRFTSVELFESTGSFQVETNNDTQGQFSSNLLPGRYLMEVIPPFGENDGASPLATEFEIREDLNLGTIQLKTETIISGLIKSPAGTPAANVTVTLQENAFDRHLYSTVTDADGRFTITAPSVALDITLVPADNIGATTHSSWTPEQDSNIDLQLPTGEMLYGSVSFEQSPAGFSLVEVFQGETRLATGYTDSDGFFELRIETGQ